MSWTSFRHSNEDSTKATDCSRPARRWFAKPRVSLSAICVFWPKLLSCCEFAAQSDLAGIGSRNAVFRTFLQDARAAEADLAEADLVVTPEYSMPWEVLAEAVRAGNVPSIGKLWVLGCESIKYQELEALKRDLAAFADPSGAAQPNTILNFAH